MLRLHMLTNFIGLFLLALLIVNCGKGTSAYPTIGSIERLEPALDQLIPKGAKLEVLAEGFEWTEGPLWISQGAYLLFSDIPPNSIYKWKAGDGHSLYLKPSGYTSAQPRGGEPGANGLLLDAEGRLVMAQMRAPG